MNLLQFEESKDFTPNMLCVPDQYKDTDFNNLDFTGRESKKVFISEYLKTFSFDGCDSLLLYSSLFSFRLFTALYKAIGSRITVDSYKFITWSSYVARLKGLGYRGDTTLQDDIFGLNFVFIFDLVLATPEAIKHFETLLEHCYINKIKLFICTHLLAEQVQNILQDSVQRIFTDKIIAIKSD